MSPGVNATAALRTGCTGSWAACDRCRQARFLPMRYPKLFDQAPAILRADAGGAFSLLAYRTALPAFIDKVRTNGIAALAINRCVHFSALWADIEPLTEQGLVALACTPSHAG